MLRRLRRRALRAKERYSRREGDFSFIESHSQFLPAYSLLFRRFEDALYLLKRTVTAAPRQSTGSGAQRKNPEYVTCRVTAGRLMYACRVNPPS
ncbi:hypothetical protein SS37A_30090 [Methylocystis iwaonis]|uniref:HEPN domain-containing protein n=1 Tax=Methylocystis iwaonis TaxID=2885079 RepID=A0ABM8EBU9_9HYPH|nr:hypothetical protein SS37A_30090 [Methylocystis iwaonis]